MVRQLNKGEKRLTKEDHLKRDFRNFMILIWTALRHPKPTPRQLEIAEEFQFGAGERRMIQAFRGVGKSYIAGAYCLWRLYKNPQIRILVVSASAPKAKEFTKFLRDLIRDVPELACLEPKTDQQSSAYAFEVANALPAQSPSVKAMGINGQLTGSRADIIIADDIEIDNNSDTAIKRDALIEQVKEFEAIIKPDEEASGRNEIIFLGTPQSADSIYDELQKLTHIQTGEKIYRVKIWTALFPTQQQVEYFGDRLSRAIREELLEDPYLEGQPTDPQRFSIEILARSESVYGKSGFALQFMLDTSLSDVGKYPLKVSDLITMNINPKKAPESMSWGSSPSQRWVDIHQVAMSGDYFYQPWGVSDKWVPYDGIVMSVDPSGRGKDETSYAVVGSLGSLQFVLACGGLNCQVGYGEEATDQLVQVAIKYNVRTIINEANFGDGMFTGYLQKALLKHSHQCEVLEIKHSVQKEKRICDTLEPVMNNHELIFDVEMIKKDYQTAADWYPAETATQYMLIYQLTRISRDKGCLSHDDRLDALAMAVAYWVDKAQIDNKQQRERREQADYEKDMERYWNRNQATSSDPMRSVRSLGSSLSNGRGSRW